MIVKRNLKSIKEVQNLKFNFPSSIGKKIEDIKEFKRKV